MSLGLTLPADAAQSEADVEELAAEGLTRLDGIESGMLLFESDEAGWYVPAPALHTNIDVVVSGPIARTTVTQRFHNLAEIFVEGTYVFPLTEGAAVDTLRMKVGDRWIAGVVEEREEARLIYEQAKAAGQVASLVEQQRPNVFITSVANISPGADVVVQIEYQQSLAPREGVFGLRIPLVVAPRYVPGGASTDALELGPDGWSDSEVVSPAVDPRSQPSGSINNPVEISVDLDAGFPLADVHSSYHDVQIAQEFDDAADIQVTGPVPADRDFYLSWKPRELTDPHAASFAESWKDDTHYITMLTPPAAGAVAHPRQSREVIFVQDTSGSMSGDSLTQAKAGLVEALKQLDENDTFTVIEFNSVFTMFERTPVRANDENIGRAVQWIDSLVATGGTEMLPALQTALETSETKEDRLRQVIFLTDGAVSNEDQMLDLIEERLADTRLFTVGIGSAPNSYFMTAAARAGRGSSVFIGDPDEVDDQMQALFAKIDNPAVVDLTLEGLPVGATVSPFPIPDLYEGDPIVLTIRVPGGTVAETIRLTGTRGNDDWHLDADLVEPQIRPGISKLWAREHIRDLEARRVSSLLSEHERDDIDQEILTAALEFGLVSRVTSLVAVDLELARPDEADSATATVPTNLPAGWDPAIFFNDSNVQGDTMPEMSTGLQDRLSNAADRDSEEAAGEHSIPFAATGGDWQLKALAGAALVAIGTVALRSTSDRRRWC